MSLERRTVRLHAGPANGCFRRNLAVAQRPREGPLTEPTTSTWRSYLALNGWKARGTPSVPKSAPTGFIRERWARHVLRGRAIDRRYYELCVLSELRDRLRAGDVWVIGSQRYRSFEERLISRETQQELIFGGGVSVVLGQPVLRGRWLR